MMPSPPACVHWGRLFWLCYLSWGTIQGDLYGCVFFYCSICLSPSAVIALSPVLTSSGIRKMSPGCWVCSFSSAALSISVSLSYLISCSPQTFPYSVIDLTLKNLLGFLGFSPQPWLVHLLDISFSFRVRLWTSLCLYLILQKGKGWERWADKL